MYLKFLRKHEGDPCPSSAETSRELLSVLCAVGQKVSPIFLLESFTAAESGSEFVSSLCLDALLTRHAECCVALSCVSERGIVLDWRLLTNFPDN